MRVSVGWLKAGGGAQAPHALPLQLGHLLEKRSELILCVCVLLVGWALKKRSSLLGRLEKTVNGS